MQVFYTFDLGLSETEVLHLHPELVQKVPGAPRQLQVTSPGNVR